jgi:hypothetical protein
MTHLSSIGYLAYWTRLCSHSDTHDETNHLGLGPQPTMTSSAYITRLSCHLATALYHIPCLDLTYTSTGDMADQTCFLGQLTILAPFKLFRGLSVAVMDIWESTQTLSPMPLPLEVIFRGHRPKSLPLPPLPPGFMDLHQTPELISSVQPSGELQVLVKRSGPDGWGFRSSYSRSCMSVFLSSSTSPDLC